MHIARCRRDEPPLRSIPKIDALRSAWQGHALAVFPVLKRVGAAIQAADHELRSLEVNEDLRRLLQTSAEVPVRQARLVARLATDAG